MPVSTPKIISVLAAFTILITSCNSTVPTTEPEVAPTIAVVDTTVASQNGLPATEADVPRVTLEETLAAIQSGESIVVDVRPPEDYQANHIVGAISIPLPEIETSPNSLDLDKDQWIITYCTWPDEHTSARAAFVLLHNGYTKVTPILGGYTAWVEAGYPTEP